MSYCASCSPYSQFLPSPVAFLHLVVAEANDRSRTGMSSSHSTDPALTSSPTPLQWPTLPPSFAVAPHPSPSNSSLDCADRRLDYTLLCLDLLPHLPSPPRPVRALDIGTGHVAIYALLLHRLHPDASIIATELDPISLAHARATVTANGAGEKVSVVEAPEGRIFPFSTPKPPISEEEAFNGSALLSEDKASSSTEPPDMDDYYAFTMCNPPFFASADDVAASRALKSASPSAAPTAAINEEVTEGGEEEFIGRMIDESAHPDARGRVGWYTSLVGRYESLRSLVPRVRAVTDNYYVVSLRQASTARWVLIWGFGAERLPDVSGSWTG